MSMVIGEWYRARWWQVRAPDGSLWGETSSEKEARSIMRPEDTLWKLWVREDREWRQES